MSDTDRKIALAQQSLALALGVSPDKVKPITEQLNAGHMDLENYHTSITNLIRSSHKDQLRAQIEDILNERSRS